MKNLQFQLHFSSNLCFSTILYYLWDLFSFCIKISFYFVCVFISHNINIQLHTFPSYFCLLLKYICAIVYSSSVRIFKMHAVSCIFYYKSCMWGVFCLSVSLGKYKMDNFCEDCDSTKLFLLYSFFYTKSFILHTWELCTAFVKIA